VRWTANEKLIVVVNFSWVTTSKFELQVPADVIATWNLKDGIYNVKDQLYGNTSQLNVTNGEGKMMVSVKPSESFIFKLP
jgi:hypothetical protein